MNFVDRTSLGTVMAKKLAQYRGKDAVIVCLQPSSLMTCLSMAIELRAWVFPLLYVPVYSDDQAHRLLGAYDQDGEFVADTNSPAGKVDTPDTMQPYIKNQQPAALKTIEEQRTAYGLSLDKQQLNGRDVILAADIMTSTLPVLVAQQFLKGLAPKSLTAVTANATPQAVQLIRLTATTTAILDILSGIFYDHDHYFEHTDSCTDEQKYTITEHIAAYWR